MLDVVRDPQLLYGKLPPVTNGEDEVELEGESDMLSSNDV
jgi:hypothetical protein